MVFLNILDLSQFHTLCQTYPYLLAWDNLDAPISDNAGKFDNSPNPVSENAPSINFYNNSTWAGNVEIEKFISYKLFFNSKEYFRWNLPPDAQALSSSFSFATHAQAWEYFGFLGQGLLLGIETRV